jgi:hypothetical protein
VAMATCLIAIQSYIELEYSGRATCKWGDAAVSAYLGKGRETKAGEGAGTKFFLFFCKCRLASSCDAVVEFLKLEIGIKFF